MSSARHVLIVVALGGMARADDAAPSRTLHGSVGAGGSLLLAGENGGSRGRLDAELDVSYGRYGGLLAWRAFDRDHRGLLSAGLVYEAAASRPRLVLDFHGELGADLDVKAPLAGGGLRTTLQIIGPLGVALDTSAYVVVDGFDHSRVVVDWNAMVVARW